MTDGNQSESPEEHEQEPIQQFIDFVGAHVPEQPNDGPNRVAKYSFENRDQILPAHAIEFDLGPSIDSPDYDDETGTGSVQSFSIGVKNPVETYDIRYDDINGFTLYMIEKGTVDPIDPGHAVAMVTALSNAEQQGALKPETTPPQ